MIDYVKTAKAIAENIGLLPRDAPADKAVDCEIIRVRSFLLVIVDVSVYLIAYPFRSIFSEPGHSHRGEGEADRRD